MGCVCFNKEDVNSLSKSEIEKEKDVIQIKNFENNKQIKF